jgi:hypothetical protein
VSDDTPSGPNVPAILAAREVMRARLAPTGKDLERLLIRLHRQSAIAQKRARESHAKLRAELYRRLEEGQTLVIHGNEVVVEVVTTREIIGAMEAENNSVKVEAMAQRLHDRHGASRYAGLRVADVPWARCSRPRSKRGHRAGILVTIRRSRTGLFRRARLDPNFFERQKPGVKDLGDRFTPPIEPPSPSWVSLAAAWSRASCSLDAEMPKHAHCTVHVISVGDNHRGSPASSPQDLGTGSTTLQRGHALVLDEDLL